MKILFVCSSLEPGRDGVGDYTRLLAWEAVRLGHTCGIIALNDSYVTERSETIIKGERGKIPCLRLPAASAWAERIGPAKNFRDRFEPDWISFQIVPYGLDDRGILAALIPIFFELTANCSLHLMFHELWTGGVGLSQIRRRLMGAIQRRSLKRMISDLQPRLVTTSNP